MPFWNLIAAYIGPLWLLLAVLVGLLLTWNVVLQQRLSRLNGLYEALTAGTSGGNLQEVLNAHMVELREALARANELDAVLETLQEQLPGYVRHVGVVRFNPFQSTGGDQSFSLAIADGDGNGLVMTSLHNRDGTRIYAKPLAAWTSAYTMTDEEREAIRKSRQMNGAEVRTPTPAALSR